VFPLNNSLETWLEDGGGASKTARVNRASILLKTSKRRIGHKFEYMVKACNWSGGTFHRESQEGGS